MDPRAREPHAHYDEEGKYYGTFVDEPEYADYSIGAWTDAHSLGWRDTSKGLGEWFVRVTLALLFVVLPIVAVVGIIIYGILKAILT